MANLVQIKDVYDYAYDIAQEFEKITNFVEIEHTYVLINKVINVLERLEDSVKQLEQLELENSELRAKYIQLNCEKTANEEEKLNLKQAFEELEESWSQESITLKSIIDKLKKENLSFRQNMSTSNEIPLDTDNFLKTVVQEQETLITKLQSHLKQKDALLEKDHVTIEILNSRVEDLLKLNKSLHLRHQEVKDLLKGAYSEKYENKFKQDLQEQKIYELENKYDAIRKSLMEKNEHEPKIDLSYIKEKSASEDSLKCLLEEQHELKQTVSKLRDELLLVKCQNEEFKRKLIKVNEIENQSSKGRIQQIFFLELFTSAYKDVGIEDYENNDNVEEHIFLVDIAPIWDKLIT